MNRNSKYRKTLTACYLGFITQAITANFAPLLFLTFHRTFQISLGKIALISTVFFFTQLLVDLFCAKYVDRIGYRRSVVASEILSASGLIGLAFLPKLLPDPYAGILISVMIYAIGSGLIEVLGSPIVEACPFDNKDKVMSLLHSFYCWGSVGVILLSTLFFAIFGIESWRILACIWALIPLYNTFNFLSCPIEMLTENGEGLSIRQLFTIPLFWVALVLMVCAGASEIAMAQWASAFAEKSLGVSKFTGDLLGPCLFAVLMGSGRVLYGSFGDRLNLRRVLSLCAGLCIISYLMTSLVPIPLVSLVGCGLCGLSASTMWPGIFSLSAKAFPKGGTAMFAMLAMFGDFGCAFGPWITGILSDAAQASPSITMDPLKFGLIFCIAFPILMIILLNFTKSMKKVK